MITGQDNECQAAKPRWVVRSGRDADAKLLAEQLNISRVTAKVLALRVGNDIQKARNFINPLLSTLLSPFKMRDMDVAAKRIVEAIRAKEHIIVFGDYDADGVTATAILITILAELGANVSHYLPSRMEEGYGISEAFIEHARSTATSLVVTVDCGTSENDNIDKLNALGIDVVVSDHHEPGGQDLPNALAVINPKRDDASYPFRDLTGAGVSFKLAWAVCEVYIGSEKVGKPLQEALLSVLPFVTIGTIADVAPMTGENRVMVAFGLNRIGSSFPGLRALLHVSRVDPAKATSRDIGFAIAPRLNAAGRLGAADLALNLLVAKSDEDGEELATILDNKNKERQALCQETLKHARDIVDREYNVEKDSVLVVCADEWHEGVIGIVAGRLSDDYNLPVAVISFNSEGKGKGSARGVPGLNLYKAISFSRDRLLTFGGHEQAAGFAIDKSEIVAFKRELDQQCRKQIEKNKIEYTLDIDCEVDLTDVNDSLLRELKMLAPFGEGNPQPIFLCRGVRVSGTPRLMGRENKHFTFNATKNRTAYRAVVFNNIKPLEMIDRGIRKWDIVFSLNFNDFYDPPRLELRIIDMQPVK